VIPGRVDNPLSAGPHQLIRDGAVLVSKLDEILEALGPLPEGADVPLEAVDSSNGEESPAPMPKPAAVSAHGITEQQHTILTGMGVDPIPVDLIVDRTGLSAQVVLQELTFLSLKGRVRRVDGQTYARRN